MKPRIQCVPTRWNPGFSAFGGPSGRVLVMMLVAGVLVMMLMASA